MSDNDTVTFTSPTEQSIDLWEHVRHSQVINAKKPSVCDLFENFKQNIQQNFDGNVSNFDKTNDKDTVKKLKSLKMMQELTIQQQNSKDTNKDGDDDDFDSADIEEGCNVN